MISVDCIIFSKDRAAQLDLAIRSLRDNFNGYGNVIVLYRYSNDEYKKGYDIVRNTDYGLSIQYVEEKNLRIDALHYAYHATAPYIMNFCDDDVFINKVDLSGINSVIDNDTHGISLKVSKAITYCYTSRNPNILPDFVYDDGKFISWKWATRELYSDWGYPGCFNANIYQKDYFLSIMKNVNFYSISTYEDGFLSQRDKFKTKIIGFCEAKVMNTPVNKVQTEVQNITGEQHYFSIEVLNNLFLQGKRISTKNIYGIKCNSCNCEIDYRIE